MSGLRGLKIARVTALLVATALAVSASAAPPPAVPATAPATKPATTPATRLGTAPASMPAIRIGYDTTRITKPLKPDGTVDYIAAINEMYSKGVTKDNNAAPLLTEADAMEYQPLPRPKPTLLGDEMHRKFNMLRYMYRQELSDRFGIAPSPDRKVQMPMQKGLAGPWAAEDIPELAKWLERNKSSLSQAAAATSKPRYFVPVVSYNDTGVPINDSMQVQQYASKKCHYIAMGLAARANLAVKEGRIDDAWADIMVIYRLSRLVGQESMLIGRILSIPLSTYADKSAQQLAAFGKLSSRQAQRIMADVADMGGSPDIVPMLDSSARFQMLAFVARLERMPPDQWLWELWGERPADSDVLETLAGKIDPNVAMSIMNRHFDAMTAAFAIREPAERLSQTLKLREQTERMKKRGESLPPQSAGPEDVNRWVADLVLSQLGETYLKVQSMADRCRALRDLTALSLALAAYHADEGKYPARLADLAPKHIKAVPTDFFAGGKEFVYKVTSRGYVLYSVGDNGKDDGGNDATSGVAGADDIVVRVGAWESTSQPGESSDGKK